MGISGTTALALGAIAIAVFALIATAGVYLRLKEMERSLADVVFGQPAQSIPERLRPRPDQTATIALALDGQCPTCHRLLGAVEAAAHGSLAGARLIRLYANKTGLQSHDVDTSIESSADSDLWTAVYEGYTPTLSVIDHAGRVVHRQFVYPDTDLDTLITDVASAVHSVAPHSAGADTPTAKEA